MKYLILFLLAFFLYACLPVTPALDPYSMQALAEGQIQATRQAQAEQEIQITRAAAKTQGAAQIEIEIIDKQAAGTATAWSVALAQATATYAETTRQASQATAYAAEDFHAATQVALSIDAANQRAGSERDRAINQFMAWFIPFAVLVAVLILESGMMLMIWSWMTSNDRAHSIFPTRWGLVVYDQRRPHIVNSPIQELPPRQIPNLSETDMTVFRATHGGSVMVSNPEPDQPGAAGIVLDLLDASIRIAGQDARQIPRWEKLPGWTKERRQNAVDALEAVGLVTVIPDKGTYLNRYDCLADLALDVERGNVTIPSPTEGG